MKFKIVIIFLTLVLAISTRGIAFNQENIEENCGTIAECLQSVIEEDNKLARENVALGKKIKELQNDEFNNLQPLSANIKIITEEIAAIKEELKKLNALETKLQTHKHNVQVEEAGGHHHSGGGSRSEHSHSAVTDVPL